MNTKTGDLILKDAEKICNKIDFSELNGKSILITGATGLIGHYLVATLAIAYKKGVNISKIFLVSRSEPEPSFASIIKNIPVQIIHGDLTDINFLITIPMADYIIHAAGYGQPGKFMTNRIKTLSLNTIGTLMTFEKLNLGGKYLFISTSEVYNGLTNPPFKEEQIGTTNTDHFRSCYIEAKRCGEAIVHAYREKGVIASSARLALAYGPGTRKDDARVINDFIRKALIDGKIELKDAGSSMRTYIYVTDAIELLFNILFNSQKGIYNVGGHSRTSILDLAKSIGEITNIKVSNKINKKNPTMLGAPDDVYIDTTLAEKEFNKFDYVNLNEGLIKTIEWQKYLYNFIKNK
jgi:UDP-glucuronate decarboxylase